MQTLGRTLTLYLTGFIIVLVLLVLFFPLGLIAFLIWLFFIYRSRQSKK
jgi:phage shock protein PspC (stress-responsive transcriptional regulator)